VNPVKENPRSRISVIIAGKVLLSGRIQAQDRSLLEKYGISHVLSVTATSIKQYHHLAYKTIPVEDNKNETIYKYFQEAHDFIDGARVCLVHCDAGVSRSATIVVSYLMKSQNLGLKDAYISVKQCRQQISPNPGFVKQLVDFEKVLFTEPKEDFTVYHFRFYYKLGTKVSDAQIEAALAEGNGDLATSFQYLIEHLVHKR